jgi:hypothetical protein
MKFGMNGPIISLKVISCTSKFPTTNYANMTAVRSCWFGEKLGISHVACGNCVW